MEKLIQRPDRLEGHTYKIRNDTKGVTTFVTINNAIYPDGSVRPYEIFMNTKHPDLFEWMTAVCVLTSAYLQRSEDIEYLTVRLKEIFGPESYYAKNLSGKSTQYHSFVGHLGALLEEHAQKTLEQGRS